MRVGSLFTGYGGLDLAIGGDMAWYSEIEPAACTVLKAHHPGVPNLGDIKKIDWSAVPPIDVLVGGYPCQPFSAAGLRKGTDDPRHLWPHVREAARLLRPRYIILENVRNHLNVGFDIVLGEIAELGYDCRWGLVRASDVGAPHQRARLFIVAYPHGERLEGAGADVLLPGRGIAGGSSAAGDLGDAAGAQPETPTDTDRRGHGEQQDPRRVGRVEGEAEGGASERQRAWGESDAGGADAAANAVSVGFDGCGTAEPASGPVSGRSFPAGPPVPAAVDWGKYAAAIGRWESVLGRAAPAPTVLGPKGKPRLSSAFTEWMMGLPAGWVTGHGLSNAQELKMCGNGVVPLQARAALDLLGVPRFHTEHCEQGIVLYGMKCSCTPAILDTMQHVPVEAP